MKKEPFIAAALALSIIAVFFIAFQSFQNPMLPQDSEKTVKIAVILPLSGSAAYYGEQARKGMEIAKSQLLEEFPSLNVELFFEDSLYIPKGGVDAFQKISSSEKIDAVITGASQVSLAVQPLAREKEILQMAIFSSSPKYSTPNDLSFRVSARNEIESETIIEFIKSKNYKKMGIAYLNNDFGLGFKETLEKRLSEENNALKISSEGFLLEASDFRTILAKLKDSDVIFLVGTARHYGLILRQAKELGIESQFLSMHSAQDPELLEIAGNSAEGMVFSYYFDTESNDALLFSKAFRKKFNSEPEAYAAEGFEGLRLSAKAFQKCGKNKQCLKDFFGKTRHDSVFGMLEFDRNGDVHHGFFLKIVKNGKFEVLEK